MPGGAGDGNRTRITCLEGRGSTTELLQLDPRKATGKIKRVYSFAPPLGLGTELQTLAPNLGDRTQAVLRSDITPTPVRRAVVAGNDATKRLEMVSSEDGEVGVTRDRLPNEPAHLDLGDELRTRRTALRTVYLARCLPRCALEWPPLVIGAGYEVQPALQTLDAVLPVGRHG